jgi:hypothetical protein
LGAPNAANLTLAVDMLRFLRPIHSSSRSPLYLPLYNRPFPSFRPLSSALMQPPSVRSRHLRSSSPPLMLDQSPFTDYPRQSFPPESPVFDSEHLIFGPLDIDDSRRHDPTLSFPWDATGALPPTSPAPAHSVTASPASSASLLDFTNSPPSDLSFTPGSFPGLADPNTTLVDLDDRNLYSHWLVDDLSAQPSASLPIILSPASPDVHSPPQVTLTSYGNSSLLAFPKMSVPPPSLEFASLQRSIDQTPIASISPPQISQPTWATHLFSHADVAVSSVSPVPQLLHPPNESDNNFATQRPQRSRNSSFPVNAIFQSSSAPPGFQPSPPLTRGYTRRAESVGADEDHDGTIRRKRKVSGPEPLVDSDRAQQSEGISYFLSYVILLIRGPSTPQFHKSLFCDPPSWLHPHGSSISQIGSSDIRHLVLANLMSHRRQRKPAWSMLG